MTRSRHRSPLTAAATVLLAGLLLAGPGAAAAGTAPTTPTAASTAVPTTAPAPTGLPTTTGTPSPSDLPSGLPSGLPSDLPSEQGTGLPTAGATGSPVVEPDLATARAGHGLAFTARGFEPGEQVTAVLDDGVVSVGPLVAGTSGEVAGVLQLPDDLGRGTAADGQHVLRVTGAASGVEASTAFAIAADDAADDGSRTVAVVFAVVCGVLLLVALTLLVLQLRRRRRRRTTPPPGVPS